MLFQTTTVAAASPRLFRHFAIDFLIRVHLYQWVFRCYFNSSCALHVWTVHSLLYLPWYRTDTGSQVLFLETRTWGFLPLALLQEAQSLTVKKSNWWLSHLSLMQSCLFTKSRFLYLQVESNEIIPLLTTHNLFQSALVPIAFLRFISKSCCWCFVALFDASFWLLICDSPTNIQNKHSATNQGPNHPGSRVYFHSRLPICLCFGCSPIVLVILLHRGA